MDKVDAYDKEQLQAMGWRFDEIETPDTAVRFVEQDLTFDQQMQVYKNLGWEMYVTDSKSFLGSTLTPEEIKRFKATSAIILADLNQIFIYGGQSMDFIRFYRVINSVSVAGININPSTGFVTGVDTYPIADTKAVYFTAQTLTSNQRNVACANIGLNLVDVSDVIIADGALDNAMFEMVRNAKCLYLDVDGIATYLNRAPFTTEVGDKMYWISPVTSLEGVVDGGRVPLQFIFVELDTSTKTLGLAPAQGILGPEAIKVLTTDANFLNQLQPVRYVAQSLTTVQQTQVLTNIGLDFVSLPSTVFDTPVTDVQDAQIKAARVVIIDGQQHVYHYSSLSGEYIYFFAIDSSSLMRILRYNVNTKTFLASYTSYLTDQGAVHFNSRQSLNASQKQQARTNIDVKSESELATSDTFSLALTGNGTFITDLVSALDSDHYGAHLAVGADLQQGLLNDADFIAELKTKLGIT